MEISEWETSWTAPYLWWLEHEAGAWLWHDVVGWFFNVALDGIGGGLVGGVIAWSLLKRTIGHERAVFSSEIARAEASELRQLVIQLLAKAPASGASIPLGEQARREVLVDLVQGALAVQALAKQSPSVPGSDQLAESLNAWRRQVSALWDNEEPLISGQLSAGLFSELFRWMLNPASYEPRDWAAFVVDARAKMLAAHLAAQAAARVTPTAPDGSEDQDDPRP